MRKKNVQLSVSVSNPCLSSLPSKYKVFSVCRKQLLDFLPVKCFTAVKSHITVQCMKSSVKVYSPQITSQVPIWPERPFYPSIYRPSLFCEYIIIVCFLEFYWQFYCKIIFSNLILFLILISCFIEALPKSLLFLTFILILTFPLCVLNEESCTKSKNDIND